MMLLMPWKMDKTYASNIDGDDKVEAIISVLNKYGMLFESQPRGYSNMEMKLI
jgi:hypothetical protein